MVDWHYASWGDKKSSDFDSFKEYDKTFYYLFYDKINYPELDITRRALLTRDLKDYPRKFKGDTNTSFCWEYSDWQVLIKDNQDKFGEFLKELISSLDIDAQLQKMILENSTDKLWDEFVKIPELLAYCSKKNIQYSQKHGWLLVQGQKTSGDYAYLKFYRTYLEMKAAPFWDFSKWSIGFYGKYGSCIYLDHIQKNIAIDLIYDDNINYKVQVFQRNIAFDTIINDLSNLALNLNWNGERYESNQTSIKNSIELIKEIQQFDILLVE